MNLYLAYIFLSTVGSAFIPSSAANDNVEKDQRYLQDTTQIEEVSPVERETQEDLISDNVNLLLVKKNHGESSSSDNLRSRRSDSFKDIDVSVKISSSGGESGHRSLPGESTSGTVYIRWGHHSCPSSSQMIYSGSAAGTSHNDPGGGVDQLCLPPNPVYDFPVSGIGGSRSFLYGAEYQIDSFPELSSRLWLDLPCAVCLAPTRFAKLVMPGTNVCPSSEWTREYGGYLMAERVHSAHHRSMHICVDREMQGLSGTSGGANGNKRVLLDLVESRCSSSGGGIPCGPYVDGYEMTCAVCTK